MPELDVAGLREQSEQETRQSEFALIRSRRARRTALWAAAGAVVTLVVVLAGAVSATGYLPHRSGPVGTPTVAPSSPPPAAPSPTPAPSDATPVPAPVSLTSMAAAPSGTLFATAQRCVSNCLAQATFVDVLLRGSNLGAAWTTIGDLPAGVGPGRLLAASDTALWLVGDGKVAGSTDGGRTWQTWSFTGDGKPFSDTAGGTAWIARNGVVTVAAGGGKPMATPTEPPGANILGLAVFGPDRAAVLTASGDGPASWFVTADRGAHWTAQIDPCASTPYPGSLWNTMAGAPDGSMWAVCARQPGTGQQPKQLVTSTDGGRTWRSRGDLESAGYATTVFPFSATVAWRTGGRADLYRTTDASHWNTVAVTGDAAGGGNPFFTALGPSTGIYVQNGAVYSTLDGGRTWQQHPLPSG